jgi:hypothetical protein
LRGARQLLKILFVAVLSLTGCTISARGAVSPEVKQIREEVKKAYLAEEFAHLDLIIDEYRRTGAKTQSGTEKIAQVYGTLSDNKELFGIINHESLGKAERLAQKWVETRPSSRAARIMVADAILARAQYARGDDYISTLTQEQFEAFKKLLSQSDAYLRTFKETLSSDPQWYVLMMRIQINLTDQYGFKVYADEALERFPRYFPIHWMIMRKVQPQWGGSVDWTKYWLTRIGQADSPEAYTRAYWVYFDNIYPNVFEGDWTQLKPGFEEIVSAYPTNWNLNAYAFFACMAEDRETLRKLLKRIGTDFDPDAWKYKDIIIYCRELAFSVEPKAQEPLAEWYLVEAFGRRERDGYLDILLGPMDLPTEQDAIARAQELASRYEGVRAYKLTPHATKRGYQRPIILFREGTIPSRFDR